MPFVQLPDSQILRAYRKAVKNMQDPAMTASEVSAGFVRLAVSGHPKVQVFVKVYRFDPELLKTDPNSGGLCARATTTPGDPA